MRDRKLQAESTQRVSCGRHGHVREQNGGLKNGFGKVGEFLPLPKQHTPVYWGTVAVSSSSAACRRDKWLLLFGKDLSSSLATLLEKDSTPGFEWSCVKEQA